MIITPEHAVEIVKEFGGGFIAYWTHHFFHKAWNVRLGKPHKPHGARRRR